MSQCQTAGGNCKLELKNGHLKCTTVGHEDTSENIVGKLYATDLGDNLPLNPNTNYNPDEGLREPAILTSRDSVDENYKKAGFYSAEIMSEEIKNEYKKMAESVAKNKGFYIGRYETSLTSSTSTSPGESGTPQSKAGVIPINANNICANTWYGLYKIQKLYNINSNSIQSSMIWGSQHDAMIKWQMNGNDANKINENTNGNHSNSLSITGNNNDKINNIYDLEGNLREWSIEATGKLWRVCFGGDYKFVGFPYKRSEGNTLSSYEHVGSRLTLYIK